jgi:hypothetical protein
MTDTNAPLQRSSCTAKPRVRADQTAPKLPLPTAATVEGSSTEAAAATDGEAVSFCAMLPAMQADEAD